MNTTNINTARSFIYFFSFIAFVYQITIFNNFDDFLCILVVFITTILTTHYCFNNNYFFQYPITLLMIFFSCFINISGALYFKSVELALLTEQLRLPLSTIVHLALFNLFIIISHKIYRSLKISIYIKNNIINFLEKYNFYNFKDIKLLYLLSIIAIISRLIYWDLNVPIEFQTQQSQGGPSLTQDALVVLSPLFILPIVIFFSNSLYNTKHNNSKIFFIIYILLAIFISLSRNNRSAFFDVMLIISIIIFLLFLFNKITTSKIFYLKFFFVLIITMPTLNFLDNLSLKYLSERGGYRQRTPIENVKSFFENVLDSEKTAHIKERQKFIEAGHFFRENYYNSTLFNRLNILLVHDNFNYLKTVLTKKQVADIMKLQVNKIISIIPQPIINIFSKNFNKTDYLQYSTASYLYGTVDYMYAGIFSIGSALMTLYIILGNWIYFLLLFLFIPFFILFDSFYNNKSMIFSPFILIFFYTTGLGVLNFLTASDIVSWISLVCRSIPQTFLFVFIISFFYREFFKKNN